MIQKRVLVLCLMSLISSIVVLHLRGNQIHGLSNWFPVHADVFSTMSYSFYIFSMLFAACWALSASSRELLWLWISLPLLSVVHFCGNTVLPFYWISSSKNIYASLGIQFFGSMLLTAVAATLLHLLLSKKYARLNSRTE